MFEFGAGTLWGFPVGGNTAAPGDGTAVLKIVNRGGVPKPSRCSGGEAGVAAAKSLAKSVAIHQASVEQAPPNQAKGRPSIVAGDPFAAARRVLDEEDVHEVMVAT